VAMDFNKIDDYPLWDKSVPFPQLYELKDPKGLEKIMVQDGRIDEIAFLHDSSLIKAGNRLIVGWYNSTVAEIVGESMIRGRVSYDDGNTWSDPVLIIYDEKKELHCVPVDFFEKDGKIYAFVSKMTSHDRPVSYDLYQLDENCSGIFIHSFPYAFIPNAAPLCMDNGNYLIPGRAADTLGGHPEVPAVLISNGDDILNWRLVTFYDIHNPKLFGLSCPETTVWIDKNIITAFVRSDEKSCPHLVFTSLDYGETWETPKRNPLDIAVSKITAGTISDGRKYLVYNYCLPGVSDRDRNLLLLALDAGKTGMLSKVYRLLSGYEPDFKRGGGWSYPCVIENSGALYISVTSQDGNGPRSCVLLKIPVSLL
ncbi:glycoside hydrolase, partial [Treponema sp. OttesenSCG-928-L16]|nr:glycoside hydrolase [Treponema sp. OttesenSCG-928-L16]